MDPEDKSYVCKLDEYSLKKALEELNEDPNQRLSSVKALRAWIRSQTHLTCRVDTEFLLQVLRFAKFSQLKAREKIECILTWRTSNSELTNNLDTHDATLLKMINTGLFVPFPKTDKEGRQIVLYRAGLVDPKASKSAETRTWLCMAELIHQSNENISVNGFISVTDMTGFNTKHLALAATDSAKKASKISQDTSMSRQKGIYLYNVGTLLELVMGLIKHYLSKKMTERLQVHNTLESLYELIPMELWPEEYLPDDYKGPSAGPISGIIDDLRSRLMESKFRSSLLEHTSDVYKIDLAKKIKGLPEESFRKLNMD